MRASAIPLGAMSLSFMACSSREVGSWEAVAVFEDGVDISDDYLYTTSTGTCTYGYSRGLTIFRWNTAFFWYSYSADCEDESYDKKGYGYAQYLYTRRVDGRLELGYFYEGKEPLLICDVGRELECDAPFFGDDIVIRFRRLRSLD